MNVLIVSFLFLSMFLIVSGIYEEKIHKLMKQQKVKYEYIPAPTFDAMLKESNEIINY
tara:strand:+ start:3835 stop:4008 length:174 start_codon:yes stop_codon:yes gene_type:complete